MNRRKFVTLGATTLSALPVLGFTSFEHFPERISNKPAWLKKLIQLNDAELKQLATTKITDASNPYFGGYKNWADMATPHSNCAFINVACCAIACPESVYYRSANLLTDITQALYCLLKLQHTDGTIDLLDTNFHSPPDTAFMVKRLTPGYKLLKKTNMPGANKTLVAFQTFLQRAGESLITGGIHTPNHRWVVCAALVRLNELWPDALYTKRANQWLSEHIDIDPDGQYTEKSTYGYSAVIDRVLITVSKGLKKPGILDAVRKNLLMMRYYIHPNGEVVTEASNRQDKGQVGTMENYYYACRYLALSDNNGEFASMCRLIESTSFNKLVEFLNYFLEDPSLWKELPVTKILPDNYVKAFPYSGLVRIRRGQWDATILSNNASWLTFHKGDAVLQGMRIAASFFGKGQFQSENIRQVGETWVLTKKLEGVYYQPFPEDKIPPDGDLSKSPKSNRPKSNIQYLETTVTISESADGINVDIEMTGTDRVPVSMELIFREGGSFTGVEKHPSNTGAFLFKAQKGSYTLGNNTIHFNTGKLEHKGIQLRGALPAMNAPTVYLTGFTPFKHRVQFS